MAIEDIGKNALQVLEKRYLAKDAEATTRRMWRACSAVLPRPWRRQTGIMMKTRILLRWRTAFTS